MSGTSDARVVVFLAVSLVVGLAGEWWIQDARDDIEHAIALDKLGRPVTSGQAPGDWDGDGFPDATDACPARPETVNGFQDGDGCPDVATTTRAS